MRTIIIIMLSLLAVSITVAQDAKTPPAPKAKTSELQPNVTQAPTATPTVQPKQAAVAEQPKQAVVAGPSKKATVAEPAKPTASPAASTSGLSVANAYIAPNLDNDAEQNPKDSFSADIKRLYCISQIKGAKDTMEIQHRWYLNDNLINTVPLMIKSANWRTYSLKTVLPTMVGDWRVAIVNSSKDEVLQTLKFTVK
jgi:hypothetical protein